jgi:hypothetical protein
MHLIHVLAFDLDILEEILASIFTEKRFQNSLALFLIGGRNCLYFFGLGVLYKDLDLGGLGFMLLLFRQFLLLKFSKRNPEFAQLIAVVNEFNLFCRY